MKLRNLAVAVVAAAALTMAGCSAADTDIPSPLPQANGRRHQ